MYFRFFGLMILIVFTGLGCPAKDSDPRLDPSWEEFAKVTNDEFWWTLSDESEVEAKMSPWPVPVGQPVKLEVLTSMGDLDIKIVEGVSYVLTFEPDVEGMFKGMQKVSSSEYWDLWEATVVVYETEPFIRFRLTVNTSEQIMELKSLKMTLQD